MQEWEIQLYHEITLLNQIILNRLWITAWTYLYHREGEIQPFFFFFFASFLHLSSDSCWKGVLQRQKGRLETPACWPTFETFQRRRHDGVPLYAHTWNSPNHKVSDTVSSISFDFTCIKQKHTETWQTNMRSKMLSTHLTTLACFNSASFSSYSSEH